MLYDDFHYWCDHTEDYCMRGDTSRQPESETDGVDRQWEDEYRNHSSSITGIFEGV